jgi:hypothetical protein
MSMMWQRHWRAGLVAVVLFILGIAAGAATMDMLQEDERTTVTRAATVTTAEATTVRRTRTRTVTAEDESALPAGWSLCTNDARGYSIGYPAGWYTTHLNDEQACEYFDPEPFEILEGTEFPPTALFATLTDEPVETYVDQLTDPMFFETIRREETRVDGRPAVIVETAATGEGEAEPGERTYAYVVDVGCIGDVCVKAGRAFVVLATALPGVERYGEFKAVVDEAVKTARFFSA